MMIIKNPEVRNLYDIIKAVCLCYCILTISTYLFNYIVHFKYL